MSSSKTNYADRLLRAKEVREILRITPKTLGDLVKSGRLTAYYTPDSTERKYWQSQVLAIPETR